MRKGNNSNKVESPWYKWGVRIGLGLFLAGGAWVAYNKYKECTEVPDDENVDGEGSSSTNDSKDKEDIEQSNAVEYDYHIESDMMAAIKDRIDDDSLFGAEDLIYLNYEDKGEIDENNKKFVVVRYLEATGKKDGRVNLVIKSRGKLERTFDDREALEQKFIDILNEVKDLDSDFRRIRFSIKSQAFVGEIDGKDLEDFTYRELRELDELEGVRYMSIDLYGCESEDGVDFVIRLLHQFHPNWDEDVDYLPIILETETGYIELPENQVVRNFLKTIKKR